MPLEYGPINRPRPYHDITEVDPLVIPFGKSTVWALHRGFREQAWADLPKSMEPDLDWWSDMIAEAAGYARRWH